MGWTYPAPVPWHGFLQVRKRGFWRTPAALASHLVLKGATAATPVDFGAGVPTETHVVAPSVVEVPAGRVPAVDAARIKTAPRLAKSGEGWLTSVFEWLDAMFAGVAGCVCHGGPGRGMRLFLALTAALVCLAQIVPFAGSFCRE